MESIPAILAYASRIPLSETARPARVCTPRRGPLASLAVSVAVAFTLAATLAPVARAGVVIVDPNGAIGGHLLEAAIAGAQEGDILLVRPGDYSTLHLGAYVLGDKSLTLVADGAGTPIVLPGVRVLSLPAGRTLWLRGFEIRPVGASSSGHALAVLGCAGLVVAEDCTLVGLTPLPTGPILPAGIGVFTSESDQVLLARCSAQGGDGTSAEPAAVSFAWPGGAGAWVQDGTAALFDCQVFGGRGGDGDTMLIPPNGGHGLRLVGGKVFVSGGLLRGGDEGVSTVIAAQPGSGLMGGLGLPWEEARLRDVIIAAGSVNGIGTPAPPIELPPSSIVDYPAAARSLALPAPLREGQHAALTIRGLQGDLVFVLGSLEPGYVFDDLHQATLVVGAPFATVVVATIIHPVGQLTQSFTMPKLPAAVTGGLLVTLQAVHFGSDGVTLGAPAGAVWIDGIL